MAAEKLRRVSGAMRRAEAARARLDTRTWVVNRRERTHHLIELGGLVQKAGLDELLSDDRAALLGALLSLSDQLSDAKRETHIELWRQRGQRAFAAAKRAG